MLSLTSFSRVETILKWIQNAKEFTVVLQFCVTDEKGKQETVDMISLHFFNWKPNNSMDLT